MNRDEHLLTVIAEEAVEVAQRATKALRFGLHETQPGQARSNAIRLWHEVCYLQAALTMLVDSGALARLPQQEEARLVADKIKKVEQFLAYSRQLGTLED